MALDFTVLEREVGEMGDLITSSLAAFNTVAEGIRQEAGNNAKLLKLANDLDAHALRLSTAMVVSTPAEPVTPIPPVEPAPTPVEPALPTG